MNSYLNKDFKQYNKDTKNIVMCRSMATPEVGNWEKLPTQNDMHLRLELLFTEMDDNNEPMGYYGYE